MAYIEYGRFRDFKSLAVDIALRVDDILYIPLFEDFSDLDIGLGDPDDAGAIAAYMDGAVCKLAVYNGDGTWSPVGGDSAPTYTLDPSLPDPPTLSYLNSNYPSAKAGDVVYWEGTTQVVEAKCYAAGEWNWITKNRCQ